MAITNANFNADDYVRSSGKRIITCSSDKIGTAGVFNYRFFLELEIGEVGSTETFSYTFRPNANNYGIINITKILQTVVKPIAVQQKLTTPQLGEGGDNYDNTMRQNIHTMPHQVGDTDEEEIVAYAMFSTGGSGGAMVQATLYDFYSTTATGVPTKQVSGSVTDKFYVLTGYEKQSDLININYSTYQLGNNSRKFLSHKHNPISGTEYNIDCLSTDFGTVACLNRTKDVNAGLPSTPVNFSIMYYAFNRTTGASVFLDQTVLANNILNGGTDFTGVSDGAEDGKMILHAGVYPANLNKLPSSIGGTTFKRPSDFMNTASTLDLAYYTVNTTSNLGTQSSAKYRFNLLDGFVFDSGIGKVRLQPCKKYDPQRFAYINDLGVYEYINFFELRTDNISSNNTTLKSSVFNYTEAYLLGNSTDVYKEQPYVPFVAHQGERTISTDFKETFTINTGNLSNADIVKVKEMFLSPLIHYINADGSARAVILESSSIEDINNLNKHYTQQNYTLTFRYSVPTYNNIIY